MIDDPTINDNEFSIGGKKNVTQEIYALKLVHSAEVLADLDADILGICEVENRFMMEELNKAFTGRNYKNRKGNYNHSSGNFKSSHV